jgi:hypothetical protein
MKPVGCGVEFRELTDGQKSQLEGFIQDYAASALEG